MESEQVINADKVETNASQTDMQTISNNMDSDCRETVESIEGEPMQQTVKSSVTTSVDADAARVELTDENSSENVEEDETENIRESESVDAVDNVSSSLEQVKEDANDSAKSEDGFQLENDEREEEETVDIQKPAESVEKEAKQTGECAIDEDDEPEEIPDDEDVEEELHRSEDDESCDAGEDHYADDDSHEAVDGEHDDIQEVSGSEVSQEDDDEEAGHDDIEEYDSAENREEHEREEEEHDEPEEEEDDDDDVAVISDTTEEERDEDEDMDQDEHEEDSRETDSKVCEQLYDSDEVESEMSDDENEDDDLMDEIISRRTEKQSYSGYRKEKKEERRREKKFKNAKVEKKSWFCDWRMKLKKRSFKWLKAARMRHVLESQGDVNVLDYIVSNVTSTPNKIEKNPDNLPPFIITQVTSIATDKVLTTSPKAGEPQPQELRLQTSSEMQQINKIQDCVKKSSQDECQEIKQQSCNQSVQQDNRQRPLDENNKENIGNNEKKKENEPIVNGIPSNEGPTNAKTSQQIAKKIDDIDESDDMEIMEISDEPSRENSSYESMNETVIDTKGNECVEDIVKKSSKCDINSIQIKAEKKVEVEKKNEEIKKEDLDHSHHNNIEKDASTKSQSKEQQPNKHCDPPKSISPKPCLETDSVEKLTSAKEVKPTPAIPPSAQQTSEIAPASSESINKRSRSPAQDDQLDSENIHPAKKLKSRIDANFATHDEILNDYVERTSNNSVDEIQKHLGQLIVEIQTLNDMIKAKEVEWNNLLHLKKVKEEICLRLTRKKQVMDILSTKVGQVNDGGGGGDNNMVGSVMEHLNSVASDLNNSKIMSSAVYAATGTSANTLTLPVVSTPMANSKMLSAVAASSTPNNTSLETSLNHAHMTANLLNNLSNISAISVSGLQSQSNAHQQNSNTATGGNSLVQNILQSRANMKSSDLVKEKATTQRLHRNILPKPSTITTAASATAATINGDSSSNSVGISLLPKLSAAPLTATNSPSVPSLSISGANVPINLSSSSNANSAHKISTGNDHQPILNNYLSASATATIQKQLGEMLNGHHNFRSAQEFNAANGGQPLGFGRQGAFKDVKSIIADYRQKHPEAVPRRGRRVKTSSSMGNLNQAENATILGNVLKAESRGSTDLSALFAKIDGNSRPSSNDSSHSATNINNNIISGNMSFKDVLIQFAKMNEQNNAEHRPHINSKSGQSNASSAPFPEVTLHPVTSMQSSLEQGAGSLLHGILTKYNRPNVSSSATNMQPTSTTSTSNYNSSFSPTLARLLTAPDRITTATNSLLPSFQQTPTSGTSSNAVNISKMVSGTNSEITITPVMAGQQVPTLLQQQLEHQHQQHQLSMRRDRIKLEHLLNAKDDEADDSIDRLVIDEGGDSSMGAEENSRIAPNAFGLEFNENEVPACQGCKKNEAQFVCAGCANQLYCSRECQVAAWDEHSEVCTG